MRPIPEPKKRPITTDELAEAGALFATFDGDRDRVLINHFKDDILCIGDKSVEWLIRELIDDGWKWSSSTEPNNWRSFEIEE
jgi:hypothetical protein